MPHRSTLADANKRRPETVFEGIYRYLYATNRRHPKISKKKGGINVHIVIHANEGVPFTKQIKEGHTVVHYAWIVTYVDEKNENTSLC